MLSLMLVNFLLSGFTFLLATRLATSPETSFPVVFELIRTDELLLAPDVTTQVPLACDRLITEVMSRKSCHKM